MEIGLYEGVITDNDVRARNGKDYIHIGVEVDDGYGKKESHIVKVWLTTDKAKQMARKSLKMCGFDIDNNDIELLQDDRKFLAGNSVPIEISENPPYGKQANIALGDDKPVEKPRLTSLTHSLRSLKSDKEPPVNTAPKSNYGQSVSGKSNSKPPVSKSVTGQEEDSIPF